MTHKKIGKNKGGGFVKKKMLMLKKVQRSLKKLNKSGQEHKKVQASSGFASSLSEWSLCRVEGMAFTFTVLI